MSDAIEAAAKNYYADQMGIGLGSQFMAVVFDALFAGVILCQITHWLPDIRYDVRHVQVIVGFGTVAALAQTLFTWVNYTDTFVENYGKFARFASYNDLGWYPVFDMFTVIPVQLFFAEKSIKINNRHPVIIITNAILILGTMSCAIGAVASTRNHTVLDVTPAIRGFLLSWPAVCTCTHVTLTTSILYGLMKNRQSGKGDDHPTNRVIDRLIMTSIESQLPATAFACAAMIVLASHPASPIVPWIIIVHPKVFMVGCLASVNSRHTWSKEDKFNLSSLGSNRSRNTNTTTSQSSDTHGIPSTPKRRTALGLTRANSGVTMDSEPDLDLEGGGHQLTQFAPQPSFTFSHHGDVFDDFEPAVSAISLVEPDLKVKSAI